MYDDIREAFLKRHRTWDYNDWDYTEMDEFLTEARLMLGLNFCQKLPDFPYEDWVRQYG